MKRPPHRTRRGFTLLEVLVALVILVTAFTVIWGTFTTTMTAWQRGDTMLEGIHHGDYIMEQLAESLRSAAYFDTRKDKYGFRLEDKSAGRYAGDIASWVSASPALIPTNSPYARGLRRIQVSIEDNPDGDAAFAVRAFAHLVDEEEELPDPWFLSSKVKGFDCRVFVPEEEAWGDEWEDTNAVPSIVHITLYMDPVEEYGPPVTISRVVPIPVGPPLTNAVPDQVQSAGGRR